MPDPHTIPFKEASGNGHYESKQLPQDRDDFLEALGLPTYAGDVVSASPSSVSGQVVTFWETSGHVIKADNHTGLAKLTVGVLDSVPAPIGAVVGTTDVQTLTNKTLDNPVMMGDVSGLDKYDVGLGNVDNTSDANKPLSSAQTAALAAKEDKPNKGVANGYAALDPVGKVPLSQIPDAIIGASRYQGTWNAATNSPVIPAAAPANQGYYYSVAVGGSTSIDGISTWVVGDTIISNGSIWQKIPVANLVQSVNAKTGIVVINKNDVGLGNADNTSDATKNSAAATLTNKTIDGANNTLNVRLNTTDVSGNLPVNKLDGGAAASTSTFWRGDGHWVSPIGAGDVQGPGSSTDGAVALFNGVTGKALRVFAGAAGFGKLDINGVVSTQAQMMAGDLNPAVISGQTNKATLGTADRFLILDSVSGQLRNVLSSVFSKLPRNYLSGGILANNATDAVNDVDVTAGVCRDDSDSADITIPAVTKQLDVLWAAGTNAGGRDTGSIGIAWWHVFAILNPTTGVSDVLFSQSVASPTMPSGFTYKRRIGSVSRGGASIYGFVQMGDFIMWNPHVSPTDGAWNPKSFAGAAGFEVPLNSPNLGKPVKQELQLIVGNTVGMTQFFAYTGNYSLTALNIIYTQAAVNGYIAWKGQIWTKADQTIRAGVTVQPGSSTTNAFIHHIGYYDTREKDA